jgi:hypothetical protein
MIALLKLSVRSAARMFVRTNRAQDPQTRRQYQRELCGFNATRWTKHTGAAQYAQGLNELFSKL